MAVENIIIGVAIIVLNLIPIIFRRFKWLNITIPVSVILALVLLFSKNVL